MPRSARFSCGIWELPQFGLEIVTLTGDNRGTAQATADVGIAVGAGTDIAAEPADGALIGYMLYWKSGDGRKATVTSYLEDGTQTRERIEEYDASGKQTSEQINRTEGLCTKQTWKWSRMAVRRRLWKMRRRSEP